MMPSNANLDTPSDPVFAHEKRVSFWFEPYSWALPLRLGWWSKGRDFEIQIGPFGANICGPLKRDGGDA